MAATMAANRTRRQAKEVEGKVQPLTKPDVMRIVAADQALQPYQDEKLEIYHREHADMSTAFGEAREGRDILARLYDQRNKEVLERLAAMRAKTDREAKRQLDRLKAFSKEFEQSVVDNKKSWKQKFVAERNEITTRSTSMGETITGLDADIVQEHEDCLAHAAAETEPLLDALSRHRKFLKRQVNERGEENDRFTEDMTRRFTALRKRLAEEEEARRNQGHDMRQRAEDRFNALEKRISAEAPLTQKGLEDCRQRLTKELELRTSSQERMVGDMKTFMAEFEESISEAGRRQEKTKAQLMKMKAMLREETSD